MLIGESAKVVVSSFCVVSAPRYPRARNKVNVSIDGGKEKALSVKLLKKNLYFKLCENSIGFVNLTLKQL